MDGMKFPNKFVENIYKANKVLGKVESVLSIALLWALIVVCMIFISCRFIFHYSTPVSYTHLDVYKRQLRGKEFEFYDWRDTFGFIAEIGDMVVGPMAQQYYAEHETT